MAILDYQKTKMLEAATARVGFKKEDVLVFDIETAPKTRTLGDLKENEQNLFRKWADNWREIRGEKDLTLDDEALYEQKAALMSPFNRVVCISFGFLNVKDQVLSTYSAVGNPNDIYSVENEKLILSQFFQTVSILCKRQNYRLAGHNIKAFDAPILYQKALLHQISCPAQVWVNGAKPWEVTLFDTLDFWNQGIRNGTATLDNLCAIFDVPSPKDGLVGAEVGKAFYEGRIDEIAEYCEKDCVAVFALIEKMLCF